MTDETSQVTADGADPAATAADATASTETSTDAAVSTDAGATDAGSTEATWRDDWRQQMAGEDAKALKQLERYNSPADVATALRAAQLKISSGELKSTLPGGATEQQVAAWRAENGIPTEPTG